MAKIKFQIDARSSLLIGLPIRSRVLAFKSNYSKEREQKCSK